MDLAVQREQQRYGMFGNGMRRIGRNSRDGKFQFPGVVHIHVIEPRTAKGHQLHPLPRQHVQTRPIQLVIDKDAHCASVLRPSGRVFGKAKVEEVPFDATVG